MMDDDVYSAHVRAAKSLPDNWRVYEWAAVETKGIFTGNIKLTGALARPYTEQENQTGNAWIKPLQQKVSMILSRDEYNALRAKPDVVAK